MCVCCMGGSKFENGVCMTQYQRHVQRPHDSIMNADGGRRGGRSGKLPGAASLYEHVDKEILVCLRDGRNFKGYLRSFDQYANVVLDNAVERLAIEDAYADVPLGVLIVRGENVMLLGEVDAKREAQYVATTALVKEEVVRAELKRGGKGIAEKMRNRWPIPEQP